jgi:hypothetical protein
MLALVLRSASTDICRSVRLFGSNGRAGSSGSSVCGSWSDGAACRFGDEHFDFFCPRILIDTASGLPRFFGVCITRPYEQTQTNINTSEMRSAHRAAVRDKWRSDVFAVTIE